MRELVIIFASLVLIFLLNVMLFIVSPYYKEKILTLKYGFLPEKEISQDDTDKSNLDNKEENKNEDNNVLPNQNFDKTTDEINDSNNLDIVNQSDELSDYDENSVEDTKKVEEKVYIPNSKEIEFLNKFDTFLITKKENYTPLLSLFRDYPDIYGLFSGNSLEINLFGENQYDNVLGYFKEKEEKLYGEVNEVNNFGDRSFYFNKIEGKVSLFLEKDSYAYGIFVDTQDYESIKNILLQ